MGMESFSIGFIYTLTTQRELVDYLKTGFKIENNYITFKKKFITRKVFFENVYRIEDYIIAHFNDLETFLSFEACFSNFKKYILLCYQIYSYIREKFFITIKLKNEILTENINFLNFQRLINDFYGEKYEYFFKKYGIKNIDMLTGEFFYKNIEKLNK